MVELDPSEPDFDQDAYEGYIDAGYDRLKEEGYYQKKKKLRPGFKYFSSADLGHIQRRTNQNFHMENLIFIAERTKFPKLKQLKDLERRNEEAGYLVDNVLYRMLFIDLMEHVENISSQQEYLAVYKRL